MVEEKIECIVCGGTGKIDDIRWLYRDKIRQVGYKFLEDNGIKEGDPLFDVGVILMELVITETRHGDNR